MPRDSNGNYTLPASYFVQVGDDILPVQHNPPFEDVAQALTDSLAADGRKVATGDLKMGGFKITGAAAATANGQALIWDQIGTDIQAYDADTAKLDVAQTWTAAQTFQGALVSTIDAGTCRVELNRNASSSWNIVASDAGDLSFVETVAGVNTRMTLTNAGSLDLAIGPMTIQGNPVASVYTGSNAGETDYPVGTTIVVNGGSDDTIVKNEAATIWTGGTGSRFQLSSVSGVASLLGEWRSRGMIAISPSLFYYLFERTN